MVDVILCKAVFEGIMLVSISRERTLSDVCFEALYDPEVYESSPLLLEHTIVLQGQVRVNNSRIYAYARLICTRCRGKLTSRILIRCGGFSVSDYNTRTHAMGH